MQKKRKKSRVNPYRIEINLDKETKKAWDKYIRHYNGSEFMRRQIRLHLFDGKKPEFKEAVLKRVIKDLAKEMNQKVNDMTKRIQIDYLRQIDELKAELDDLQYQQQEDKNER
tara:strand:+ start:10717 stop:11055 length:339 start_codon:yes stop_codon:yes gene_type:complete